MRIAIGLSLGARLCVFVLHAQVDAQRTEAALPLSIDGSRQPELISDSLALRHVILALVTSPSAGLVEHERRDALLSRVQLISENNHAFLAILGEVRARLALIPQDGGPNARAQQLAALDEAGSRLSNTLSAQGWVVLQDFVRTRVKTKIRVYGEPRQRYNRTTETMMLRFPRLIGLAFAGLALPGSALALGMSFSVYADAAPNSDLSYLHVSSSVTDGSWGCSHSTYMSTVSVYSPSNRSATATAGGLSVGTAIPISAEFGNYTVATYGSYQCSCMPGGSPGFGGGQTVPVTRPGDLRSVPPDSFTYRSPGNYLLTRIWQVYDDQGQTWTTSGTSVTESYQAISNGCNIQVNTAQGPVATNNQGRFQDKYGAENDTPNAVPQCVCLLRTGAAPVPLLRQSPSAGSHFRIR